VEDVVKRLNGAITIAQTKHMVAVHCGPTPVVRTAEALWAMDKEEGGKGTGWGWLIE
jgi:hypothetical protein